MASFANLKNNGRYYNIEKAEQIADCFANCLAGLMSVMAKDIYISIRAGNPEQLPHNNIIKIKKYGEENDWY